MPTFPLSSLPSPPSLRTLRVAREASAVGRLVYLATAKLPPAERSALGAPMRRAAVCVYARIAEAHGRSTSPDARRLFGLAESALHELQAHVERARSASLLDASDADELRRRMRWVDQLLAGYQHALARRS